MKRSVPPKLFPWLSAVLGAIVLVSRYVLYTMENQSGLLPQRHPLYLLSLLAAVCTLGLTGFVTLQMAGPNDYEANFPFSRNRAQCSFLSGLLLFPVATGIWANIQGPLDLIWGGLALAAAACLMASAYIQLKGARPHFLLYFVICLFFLFHMICKYRIWSGNPQVEDYIFSLFGCVFLALFAYHKTLFSTGEGKRRMTLFAGLMAVFFCICSIAGSEDARFFSAGAIWTMGNLCAIEIREG